MVVGLRRLPDIKLAKLPRMADFALWATACEPAYAVEGTFARAYDANLSGAIELMLETNPIAAAVRTFAVQKVWEGTATELLPALTTCAGSHGQTRTWPKIPSILSGRLRRIAPALRTVGIHVTFGRDAESRGIRIERMSDWPLPTEEEHLLEAEKVTLSSSSASPPSSITWKLCTFFGSMACSA